MLLSGLGIPTEYGHRMMKTLEGGDKVRVLIAQALFNNPDILLLDEPTNHLDLRSITWLEEFLSRFTNTVIIVSHDRHFLNQVCTHVADIDFGKIQLYVGNYDFWYQASQLHLRQKQNENAKTTAKVNDLKAFIQRFSANASKSKQATSRKKLLEKLTLEDMPVSSRKYPYINFTPERPCGDIILEVKHLCKKVDGVAVLDDFSLTVNKGDKIAFVGDDGLARTTLFQILAGEIEPDSGYFRWGVTITTAYFPKENSAYFDERPEPRRVAAPVQPARRGGELRPGLPREDALLGGRGAEEDHRPLRRREGPLHAREDDARQRQRADPGRADQPPRPGDHHRAEQRADRLPRGAALRLARPRVRLHAGQPDRGDHARRGHRPPDGLRRVPGSGRRADAGAGTRTAAVEVA